ncbi:MAG TPA: hypothetical protein VNU22_12115 [Candidatus Acidoferrum sp.]|nr:hypothetical protein [Candidatus Acidoferrum sp.]
MLRTRPFIGAAILVVCVGAARGPAPGLRPLCAFNLPLTPAMCARLRNSTHAASHSWNASRSNETLVYTSQPFSGIVAISALGPRGFKPAGTLVLPSQSVGLGLTVDASQNLYVAISTLGSGTPSVEVFPRGATQPNKTYTDGLTAPVDVAVDHYGTVYVANLASAHGSGCKQGSGPGGDVVEYASGSTTPTRTISGFPGCPNAVAVDAKANLYLTYTYYPSSGFVESDVIKYGYQSTKGKALNLQVPGGPQLGGIAVTQSGDLVVENVEDDATLNQILTFGGGSKKPTSTIQYGGTGWGTAFKFFALLENRLYAPAYVAQSLSFLVGTPAEFTYPSGRQLSVQDPAHAAGPWSYGFAVSPGT